MLWKIFFHSVENRARIFHSVEKILVPRRFQWNSKSDPERGIRSLRGFFRANPGINRTL